MRVNAVGDRSDDISLETSQVPFFCEAEEEEKLVNQSLSLSIISPFFYLNFDVEISRIYKFWS